jgi:large subunit ribosomal protein L19
MSRFNSRINSYNSRSSRDAVIAMRDLMSRQICSLIGCSSSSSSSSVSSSSTMMMMMSRTKMICAGGLKNRQEKVISNNKEYIHSSAQLLWKNHGRNTERLSPPERNAEAPMTSFEAGKFQLGWGKAGGGMSPFTKTRELIKRKTYEKRAGHMIETIERERITEMLKERQGVNIAAFRPGDVIKLTLEVPENKRRTQIFTGICIARKNRGLGSSFTLRTMLGNVGVERQFPLYTPNIKDLTVIERKRVRRSKLYYLRDRPARFSRVG